MKNAIKYILIIIGSLLLINVVLNIIISILNFNFGLVFEGTLGITLMLYGIFFDNINKFSNEGWTKYLKYFIFTISLITMIFVVFIAVYGQHDTVTYKEDAVIILGAGINGEKVSPSLAYRLEKGIEYVKKNSKAIIVVSGGQGKGESITEAFAMERYLIKRGVSSDKILKEEKSTNTYENFLFSKKIVESCFGNKYKCAFITSNFHVFRARLISKEVGLDCTHMHASVNCELALPYYLREILAFIKLLIFDK